MLESDTGLTKDALLATSVGVIRCPDAVVTQCAAVRIHVGLIAVPPHTYQFPAMSGLMNTYQGV